MYENMSEEAVEAAEKAAARLRDEVAAPAEDFGYEQMIEQMAAKLGQEVQMRRAAEQQALRYADTLDNLRVAAIEIAAGLAYAGSYPHKEKNEAILHAVARLLAMSTNYPKLHDDGQVPF